MIIWFIAAFVLLLTFGILLLVLPGTMQPTTEESDGPWDLSTGPTTPKVEDFAKKTNGTLRVFYYIDSLPRTNMNLLDGDGRTISNFNQQTNTFDICPITTSIADCPHPGFIKLLNISDSLLIELLQAPDASRPGLPKTQLTVKTRKIILAGGAKQTQDYLETFSLPEFPMQKWVMLTVVRSGNRISIYYNDRMVFSKTTTNVPNIVDGTSYFSDSNVKGTAKYFMNTSQMITSEQVNADFNKMADTTGRPLDKLFQKLNISLCPSGECFRGPQIRPANPLIQWNSDVM